MVGVGLGILRGRSGPAWLLSRIRARTPQKGIVRPIFRVVQAMSNPFRYFNSSPKIIRLAVLMYVKYPRTCSRHRPEISNIFG